MSIQIAQHMIAMVIVAGLAYGQTTPKTFDVATIKPSANDDGRFALRNPPGGNFVAIGVPLRMLIMQAYDVQAFEVSGGPSWVSTDRWDIQAKAEGVQGQVPIDQSRAMIRALLEERFQLKVRRETREMPIYDLVVGKSGSKLTVHDGGPALPGEAFRLGAGSLSVKKGSVSRLAAFLTQQLGRNVVDKTGLRDEYDFTLKWMPEPGQGGPEAFGLPPQAEPAPAADRGPSIFTAVQEQLGLRLDAQKGPVEVVVIENVEKPTNN